MVDGSIAFSHPKARRHDVSVDLTPSIPPGLGPGGCFRGFPTSQMGLIEAYRDFFLRFTAFQRRNLHINKKLFRLIGLMCLG